MIAETLSQNTLAILSIDITLQLYTIDNIDNRVTSKFIKNPKYYRCGNHQKFTNFIDTLLTIITNIPKIKNFIMKDYNSYEFGKLEIININGNKNKLLRKYISNLNKEICEFNSTIDNHCDSCAKSKKQISKMFF
jgi:hypothetical protein